MNPTPPKGTKVTKSSASKAAATRTMISWASKRFLSRESTVSARAHNPAAANRTTAAQGKTPAVPSRTARLVRLAQWNKRLTRSTDKVDFVRRIIKSYIKTIVPASIGENKTCINLIYQPNDGLAVYNLSPRIVQAGSQAAERLPVLSQCRQGKGHPQGDSTIQVSAGPA